MTSLSSRKIIPFEEIKKALTEDRQKGKKIVLCHGTFDLVHPGHIHHLEEASRMGDVLVVSVTSSPYVNKGPGRPVYNDEQRLAFLAALQAVDYVILVPYAGAIEIIDQVRPSIYCKGLEYAEPQNSTDRKVFEDIRQVRKYGGEVRFVGNPLYSSSKLLNGFFNSMDPQAREYLSAFPEKNPGKKIDDCLKKISKLKVAVVGDLIADRYIYSRVQGLTSKARILSVRPKFEETYMGGAFAIARHVESFVKNVKLVSICGEEPWLRRALSRGYGRLDISPVITHREYQTILKERFVEQPGQRKELIKIFAVNRLQETPPAIVREKLNQTLNKILPQVDVVILADYGHGMIDEHTQTLLERKSPWLALNCQTNSYNHGYNLITKYRKCHLFALDEGEIRLAYSDKNSAPEILISRLTRQLRAQKGHLTLGSTGSLACSTKEIHRCPAMTKSTIDTVGAGDAYFSVVSLLEKVGAGSALSSFMGNIAGGIAANIVGNKDALDAGAVAKNAQFMLKSCRPEHG